MSDAAQGAIELAVFFVAVVVVGWVMRGRLTDIAAASRDADGDAGQPAVEPRVGARRVA